jgi:predicted PurR-regulated permease PerM
VVVALTFFIVAVILYLFLQILLPFVMIFFTAMIIGIFLYPFYEYLNEKLNLPKSAAALLTLLFFLIAIFLPLYFVFNLLFDEVSQSIVYIQKEFNSIGKIQTFADHIFATYNLPSQDISQDIKQYLINALAFISQHAAGLASITGNLLIKGFLTLLLAFYVLTEKERIVTFLKSINPLGMTHYERLKNRGVEVIDATVKGMLAIILLQSVFGILGTIIFGVFSPFLIGFTYGLSSIVPLVGNSLVWIPVAIYLFFTKNIFYAIAFIVWCNGTNFVVDHFISPRILGKATHLHPIIILFSVLGGIQLFGFLGIILGPTIAALSIIEIEIYRDMLKNRTTV